MTNSSQIESMAANKIDMAHYFRQKGLQLDLNASALSKVLARFDLYRMVQDVPGDIIECGVYRGAALFQWANYIEIFSPKSQKSVIGFDTFNGFPDDQINSNDKNSLEVIKGNIHPRSVTELMEIADQLKISHRIKLVSGDATHTIISYVKEHPSLRISLLHIDFDTYAPTKAALSNFYNLITIGGIIAFDQYADRNWGETQAVDEFFDGKGLVKKFKILAWSSAPRAYYVKE